ncbi:hypothetical protein I8D64_08100 [Brachybacterium sp. MASK1Z-5]|uniref:Serine/threonine protein kinase n=1 Tax=Brachybacterium halotolerans TaxID=2795215 RepID=A0ABS1BB23_9MICO|nr:hypothetical protein [Brachybacterium halotolerans]MBK0331362.1 hypothetical protein [Brachybacterium halotolerans]
MNERHHEHAVRERWSVEAKIPLSGVAEGASWHRARSVRSGELVTLFMVHGDLALEVADAARRAYLVENPRLLPVLDVTVFGDPREAGEGSADGAPLTVVEYPAPPAPPLAALFAQGALRPETARSIIGEAASGLEAARRRGLRHQHLDSNRVFVDTASGEVAVLGVGVEAAAHRDAEHDGRLASFLDVTALVALLYRALTGASPSAADGPLPRPSRISTRNIPQDLDMLCELVLTEGDQPVPETTRDLIAELEPWQSIPVTLEAYDPQDPSRAPRDAQATTAGARDAGTAGTAGTGTTAGTVAATGTAATAGTAAQDPSGGAQDSSSSAGAPSRPPGAEDTSSPAPEGQGPTEGSSTPPPSASGDAGARSPREGSAGHLDLDQEPRADIEKVHTSRTARRAVAAAAAGAATGAAAGAAGAAAAGTDSTSGGTGATSEDTGATTGGTAPTTGSAATTTGDAGASGVDEGAPSGDAVPTTSHPSGPSASSASSADAGASPSADASSSSTAAPTAEDAAAPEAPPEDTTGTEAAEFVRDLHLSETRNKAAFPGHLDVQEKENPLVAATIPPAAAGRSAVLPGSSRDADEASWTDSVAQTPVEEEDASPGPIIVRGRPITYGDEDQDAWAATPHRGSALVRDVVGVAMSAEDSSNVYTTTAEPDEQRSRQTQWILIGAALVVIIALVFAITSVTSGLREAATGPNEKATTQPAPTESKTNAQVQPTETTESATEGPPPTFGEPEIFAEGGNGNADHSEDSSRLTDGSKDSYWSSKIYQSADYSGLKDGIGIKLPFEKTSTLKKITVSTADTEGGSMELYAQKEDGSRGDKLGDGEFTDGGDVEFTLDEPVQADGVELWIAELPSSTTGDGFRARIQEIKAE